MQESYYCNKCRQTLVESSFYRSNNLEKYPQDGIMTQCKKCLTMHVNNWDPDTFTWILQEIDVPYVPDEWNKLMAKYAKDSTRITGATILGRYLSKMKLKQYKDYRWADTEFLQQLANSKMEQAMKRSGYNASEIATAIQQSAISMPPKPPPPPQPEQFTPQSFTTELNLGLTDEDITYLRLKWGSTYRQEEWVSLEQLYNDMMQSYDIQTAGHIDTLKLLCKTSLKANQLIDIGDVEGFQKMQKAYDSLMKSGKFTAVQNKTDNGDYVDSISELVAICEAEGFIPRYYVDEPQDKVDRVLEDLQRYTHNLITEETNIGSLIENAIKQIEKDKEKDKILEATEGEEAEDTFEEDLFDYDKELTLTQEDYEEFQSLEELLAAEDNELFAAMAEEEAL